jgi:cytochrome c-type biogenesis protein CcmE
MDPARKRKIRLVVALGAAVLLGAALVYTSFSASAETTEPSALLASRPDGNFDLTGVVVDGTVKHRGSELDFSVADRDDPAKSVPVRYTGEVPDPFREGREIIVTGRLEGDTVIAEKDSLITKCPSKFADEAEADDHVVIDDS